MNYFIYDRRSITHAETFNQKRNVKVFFLYQSFHCLFNFIFNRSILSLTYNNSMNDFYLIVLFLAHAILINTFYRRNKYINYFYEDKKNLLKAKSCSISCNVNGKTQSPFYSIHFSLYRIYNEAINCLLSGNVR